MLLELRVKTFEQKGADCNFLEGTFSMIQFNQPAFGLGDAALCYCEPGLIFRVEVR